MAQKTVTYKEPAGYFNAEMKKAAKEWDKKNAEKAKKPANTGKKK